MIERGLVTRLAGLAGGRIYPAPAPPGVSSPFITYQRVDTVLFAEPFNPAIHGHEIVQIQIDCWSDDGLYGDALELAEDVRIALFGNIGLYDGVDVVDVRLIDGPRDVPEVGPNGPVARRLLSFGFYVRR